MKAETTFFAIIICGLLLYSVGTSAACAPKVSIDLPSATAFEARANALIDEVSRMITTIIEEDRAFTAMEVKRLVAIKVEKDTLLADIKASAKVESSVLDTLAVLDLLLGGLK